MSANEFLEQLEESLSGLKADERENAMNYYREYFMEAGEENEDDAAARLGSPQSVAERIISEAGDDEKIETETSSFEHVDFGSDTAAPAAPVQPAAAETSGSADPVKIVLAILVLVFGMPIWLPIMIVLVTLICVLAVVPVVIGVSAIAGFGQGIMEIFSGSIGYGIMDIGAGLTCAGFTMLIWKPFGMLIKLIGKGFKAFFKGLFGRRK